VSNRSDARASCFGRPGAILGLANRDGALMNGWFDTIVGWLGAPLLNLADPLRRIYWLYLLSALAIAGVIFAYQQRIRGRALLQGFLSYVAPRGIFAHRSARLDYLFFYLNTALFGLLLAPLLAGPP